MLLSYYVMWALLLKLQSFHYKNTNFVTIWLSTWRLRWTWVRKVSGTGNKNEFQEQMWRVRLLHGECKQRKNLLNRWKDILNS